MARTVDDEVVILDVGTGHYFGLNDVGALVWSLLDGDHDHEAIVDAITSDFDVDAATASADLTELLTELSSAGLIVDSA